MMSRYRTRTARPQPIQSRLYALNKPFNVLSQFSGEATEQTLKAYFPIADAYPAGRLDKDSEGLLLLTNDGRWQQRIAAPAGKFQKTYWVQVEGVIDPPALATLRAGVLLNDGMTRPAHAQRIEAPSGLWPRTPAVRFRANIPTSWLELTIDEGRNRQVRRMTAAVGFPTLRLIRVAIGPYQLGSLAPGEWQEVAPVW